MDFEIIAEGLLFPEGPIAMADGSIVLVEAARGTLSRVWRGRTEVIANLGDAPNGAAIGPDGAVYVCNNGGFEWREMNGLLVPVRASADYKTGRIERVDLDTGRFERIYETFEGERLLVHGHRQDLRPPARSQLPVLRTARWLALASRSASRGFI